VDNLFLYKTSEVINKYASFESRVRQLNNAERNFVDTFKIHGLRILVIGSGAGRVPANLALFGNIVVCVERSKPLHEIATKTYSQNSFRNLNFIHGDFLDINLKEKFDLVFFPMNGIDHAENLSERNLILEKMKSNLKSGGLLAFSSHNIRAYILSNKVNGGRSLTNLYTNYDFANENVTGGGVIFRGSEKYIVNSTESLLNVKLLGICYDVRNRIESKFVKFKIMRQFIFPYAIYVFQNQYFE
jgi:SAM-dependent methyltransferase